MKTIYTFGNGQAEGRADMRDLLGGKGANLAEMNLIGVPVPPGFTITTDVCRLYNKDGRDAVVELIREDVKKGYRSHREPHRQQVQRSRKSSVGFGALGCPRVDARYDGHRAQPGYQRRCGRDTGREVGKSSLCMG